MPKDVRERKIPPDARKGVWGIVRVDAVTGARTQARDYRSFFPPGSPTLPVLKKLSTTSMVAFSMACSSA